MSSRQQFQKLWNEEYKILFDSLERFIFDWERKIKKCNCQNPECKHYQKEKRERYGVKIDLLFESSLKMNARSFVEKLDYRELK